MEYVHEEKYEFWYLLGALLIEARAQTVRYSGEALENERNG